MGDRTRGSRFHSPGSTSIFDKIRPFVLFSRKSGKQREENGIRPEMGLLAPSNGCHGNQSHQERQYDVTERQRRRSGYQARLCVPYERVSLHQSWAQVFPNALLSLKQQKGAQVNHNKELKHLLVFTDVLFGSVPLFLGRKTYREIGDIENNRLTIGEQKNAIENVYNLLLTEFRHMT